MRSNEPPARILFQPEWTAIWEDTHWECLEYYGIMARTAVCKCSQSRRPMERPGMISGTSSGLQNMSSVPSGKPLGVPPAESGPERPHQTDFTLWCFRKGTEITEKLGDGRWHACPAAMSVAPSDRLHPSEASPEEPPP